MTLERDTFHKPLTVVEVLEVFKNSEPCASLSSCEQRFSSHFYPCLDEPAEELNIKQAWEDQAYTTIDLRADHPVTMTKPVRHLTSRLYAGAFRPKY